jgi:site-specific DNA-methyltransferase (adenine-specific)|nr:MAG TPA: ParB protein [Caudoviricetes sp.]
MEIIYKKLSDIKPYSNNPRQNDEAVKYVAESIKEFGFKVPIIIDNNGTIVAGHTRYKAANKLKMEQIPCVVADDLTEEQIKAFRLADNKVGEFASWDIELLVSEIDEILDVNMADFGFSFALNDIDVAIDLDEPQDVKKNNNACRCPKCGFEFEA